MSMVLLIIIDGYLLDLSINLQFFVYLLFDKGGIMFYINLDVVNLGDLMVEFF